MILSQMEDVMCETKETFEFSWGDNFPKGYGHTSLAYLKHCRGFDCAKNGDFEAACFVVSKCSKPDRLQNLRKNHPNSFLLPVVNQNLLPLALAQAINLPIWCHVYIVDHIQRKALPAIQRLQHRPVFAGYIKENLEYIIVDDIITQGGTISALRDFVMARGGKVVAVTALAFSIGSHDIAPTKRIVFRLTLKFGHQIHLLNNAGILKSFETLTHSQARYLLMFSSVWNILKKAEEINNNC